MHLSSFSLFNSLAPELRNHIWKICAEDYPARVINLRGQRRTIISTCGNHTKVVIVFKSTALAPTLLYACRDSRSIAQGFYAKAFGTPDSPAETWINFGKDMLLISPNFCNSILQVLPHSVAPFGYWGVDIRKEPYGCPILQLSEDIQKVKDLAICPLMNCGELWYTYNQQRTITDIIAITEVFGNIERLNFMNGRPSPDSPGRIPGSPLKSELLFADHCPKKRDTYISSNLPHLWLSSRCQIWVTQEGIKAEAFYGGYQETWKGSYEYSWSELRQIFDDHPDVNVYAIPLVRDSCLVLPDPELRAWTGHMR